MTTDLELTVELPGSPEHAWLAVTDWPRQGEWILGTTVAITAGDGCSVGSTLAARTGWGPIGFLDTMEITEWDPARRRCVVRHTGQLVRGGGVFAVTPRPGGGSVLHWTELLELPFGALGRLGWPVVRPVFAAGIRLSLRRFVAFCANYDR
ncbi:MAG: SRPBCC family protein [Pseudonocardia sp.]|nr:SRPBCC family protein [Pseudonocardia sp.]